MHSLTDRNGNGQMLPPRNTEILENTFRRSPIPEDIVYQQVARIISSRQFSKSKRLGLFLQFTVTATLKGETESLKEWVIGTDVYNRGKDFDPRLDPIVRTETRRLRRKLKEYYETQGQQDPLVIELPKGSYVVNFRDQRDEDLFKLPGEVIAGYFVLDRLDEGPDTVTYRVRKGISASVLALKVISGPTLATPRMRQILEADVAAASVLHHENVCCVHKLEPSGVNACIVTDYFEGLSVAETLANAPTWEQTIDIAVQLVAGLAAAHRQHITHGDLNPSSVRVAIRESDQMPVVKIVDFGMSSVKRTVARTEPSLFPPSDDWRSGMGDARSDVRAAGAILFQLFTGSLPESEMRATAWRGKVPEEQRRALGVALARCLAPNPFEGYADAIELEAAFAVLGLRSRPPTRKLDAQLGTAVLGPRTEFPSVENRAPWTSGPRLAACALVFALMIAVASNTLSIRHLGTSSRDSDPRLGVLAVECPTRDHECEVLGGVLTGSLGARLMETGSLKVVVDDAPQLRAEKLSIPQIASRLGVDHVLTTTVEKTASAWRLSARILRGTNQTVEWAKSFECSWTSISDVQSQLLNDVMAYLRPDSLVRTKSKNRGALESRSAEEYEQYARAWHAVDTFATVPERVDFDYAEQRLKRVLILNADFNDARVLLASLYYRAIWVLPQRSRLLRQSKSLLEMAIQKEPARADAHALLAGVYGELGQRDRAMDLAGRALKLGPLECTSYRELGKLYAEAGFFESAVIEEDRALALDPANLLALSFKILSLSWMDRRAEAASELRTFRGWAPGALADMLETDRELRIGHYAKANRLISEIVAHKSSAVNRPLVEIEQALCSALAGRSDEATKILSRYPNQQPMLLDHYILLAAQIGDTRRVVDYVRENPLYFNYRYLVSEPRLAPVRSKPPFKALLQEAYNRWQTDLDRFGASLPALPASPLSPPEFPAPQ